MKECYNNNFDAISDITDILKETPDEDKLVYQLLGIEDKWYRLGKLLHVHRKVLDHIKQSQGNNIDKLKKVFKLSLPVTWEQVIAAIEGPIIKNKKKAKEIRHHLKLGKLSLLINDYNEALINTSLLVNSIVQFFDLQKFIILFHRV